ncbi:hypothetical protein BFV94_2075 [Alteromonas macleodii]|uniref:Uncharacterized protein n=1 Tax=Alteromonas macleodii TaxID=28108 RepID=A0AB36FYD3_ALTMA|nr:hypothetical protein BFV95_2075 [Alteromonas macleodii]OES32172.1 hypothetical protein BFV94_2075 [Alteromonas macleodii]OES32428.1 hypothetical protein BFV93_2067 [Alteromonas macleodii]OES41237.1 hypothetical protein BFV96_2061 [Alteromonas macleodii]
MKRPSLFDEPEVSSKREYGRVETRLKSALKTAVFSSQFSANLSANSSAVKRET